MNRLLPLLSILLIPLMAGCVAAGAGAAAGAAAADNDWIEYYIITEAPPDSIAEAMRNERFARGMDKAEVRLVAKSSSLIADEPEKEELAYGERWTFESSHNPEAPGYDVEVRFDNRGLVMDHNY